MNEKELADLKAELEMPIYEEFEALTKRLETLEFKFNELIDILRAHGIAQTSLQFSKVNVGE